MTPNQVKETFHTLPEQRKQVLLGILKGHNREKIMVDANIPSEDALSQHKRQLYKVFKVDTVQHELDDPRSGERKLGKLIALFAKSMPELMGNLHLIDAKQPQKRWEMIINATLDECDEEMINLIFTFIKERSRDASLTLKKVESGSIKIVFEGSQDGFREIQSLFQSGELTEVLGIPILGVREIAITPSENPVNLLDLQVVPSNDPITALTTFLGSNDSVAVRVRERLENSSISEIVEQFNTAYRNNPATTLPYELADILAGSTPAAQNKNFRSANEGSEYSQLLSLARELAKKLAEIWGNAE